ncbi:Leucine--tRNA ligase [Gracilaria domingensis]|nr:Leucine--tRNA ligase [Gracilaria domingensis]
MVCTRLSINRGVDGVALSELDLVVLAQLVKLPANEGVVVRVDLGGDEGAPPIGLEPKVGERVRKFGQAVLVNAALAQDLPLVLLLAGLARKLALLGLGPVRAERLLRGGVVLGWKDGGASVGVNFVRKLVCAGLDGHSGAVEAEGVEAFEAFHSLVRHHELGL